MHQFFTQHLKKENDAPVFLTFVGRWSAVAVPLLDICGQHQRVMMFEKVKTIKNKTV